MFMGEKQMMSSAFPLSKVNSKSSGDGCCCDDKLQQLLQLDVSACAQKWVPQKESSARSSVTFTTLTSWYGDPCDTPLLLYRYPIVACLNILLWHFWRAEKAAFKMRRAFAFQCGSTRTIIAPYYANVLVETELRTRY